jgi:hypothetical protein
MTPSFNTTGSNRTRSILSTLGFLPLIGLAYLQFWHYIIPGLRVIVEHQEAINTRLVGMMWVPINGYLLISSCVCLAVNIFKPLKPWNEERGLISTLLFGLFIGSIFGLCFSFISMGVGVLVFGFLDWSLSNFIYELLMGFNFGILVGLLVGLVLGLFSGLIYELEE